MDSSLTDSKAEMAQSNFAVLGIGASAGGLEAMGALLGSTQRAPGLALILLQHLDPAHETDLPDRIRNMTAMPVVELKGDERIEPDNIYVVPAGHKVAIRGGVVKLDPFTGPVARACPIDGMFATLAATYGTHSVAAVLSGTGSDGSSGMRAVKEMGGLCIAQDLSEVRYDAMPRSAIATGLVDYVLPAGSILSEVKAFFSRGGVRPFEGDTSEAGTLRRALTVLRERVGHDFSGYKESTLRRRIERRMQILGEANAENYISLLRGNRDECEALFSEFLINVTKFFRDPEHFETLRRQIIAPLIEAKAEGEEVRVWVAGSSSGQEAYSIAMLVDEAMRQSSRDLQVQIFATDIDERMVRVARKGLYPASAVEDIPERLRESNLMMFDDEFQIAPHIRDMVRFSVHSIVRDPPFLRLDLISCRNLFIYFGEDIQSALSGLMHYALRTDGALFLGPSEGLAKRGALFETADAKARIYRRREAPRTYSIELPIGGRMGQPTGRSQAGFGVFDTAAPNKGQRAASHAAILERYAPVFVRVTSEGDVVSSVGDLSAYLVSTPGDSDLHISRLARGDLRHSIQLLLSRVQESGERRVLEDVKVTTRFGQQTVDVVGDPMADGTIAIVFIETSRFKPSFEQHYIDADNADDRIVHLEEELRRTRHRLRGTVEELETANEELKSSNEEMMSMNEELQSANEELSTVNEELKNKITELGVANDDLLNFLRSTSMAVIVVDADIRVRLFTEQACSIFAFKDGDKGRPLRQITSLIDEPNLLDEVRGTIEDWTIVERPIFLREDGRIFLMRIFPYRASDGGIGGATLVFNDVTAIKTLEADLQAKSERLTLALKAGRLGVWEYDVETGTIFPDERVAELLDLRRDAEPTFEGVTTRMHKEDEPRIRETFERTIETGEIFDEEFRIILADGRVRWIKGLGQLYETGNGKRGVFGVNYDITFEEEAKEQQILMVEEMNHRVKNLFAVIASLINTSAVPSMDIMDYSRQLNARVNALGRAYELTQTNAADAEVDLETLLTKLLSPHVAKAQMHLEGEAVAVPADALTPLSLIIHELATNAVKYGALSDENGAVEVIWSLRETDDLRLQWNEKLTKPVQTSQEGPGFGTRLVDASVRQLRGTVERNWTRHGLVARFELTLPTPPARRG
ncbi:MAG: CheR family methyltransferase [Parvularcula sp.]|nr:CheR family methyltransferase [Parvularcula sp.]